MLTDLRVPAFKLESHPGVERRARWKEKKKRENEKKNKKKTFHPANIVTWRMFTLKEKVVFGIVFFFFFTKVLSISL